MRKSPPKCLVQPGDGVGTLIKAIESARKSVDIVIFRFDRREIEKALYAAAARGVHVHALTAFTNKGGEKTLRALEMRLLAAGVTVARTADDLVRYHGKMMIIDNRELHVMAFNFTSLDIEHSRSFGVVTTDRKLVAEAARLFAADVQRHEYVAGSANLLVSPVNARKELRAFIRGAKKELLIYDPEVSDPEMLRLLTARAKAGVTVKIIGKVSAGAPSLRANKLHIRLHTRTIVRDGAHAFVGSQSLRTLELDSRREIGIMVRDAAAVARIAKTFDEDWQRNGQLTAESMASEEIREEEKIPASKVAKEIAKAVARDLVPVGTVVESTVREIAGPGSIFELNGAEVDATVKNAVKEAVKEAVRNVVEEAVEQMQGGAE